MRIVTPEELEQALRDLPVNGTARMASVWTETEPKMLVKHRVTKQPTAEVFPQGVIRKAKRSGVIGAKYGSVVNRQRLHEASADITTDLGDPVPEFKPESLWKGKGEYVQGSDILVRHTETGQIYLVFCPSQKREGHSVAVSESTYYCKATGRVVEDAELEGFLSGGGSSKRQGVKFGRQWRCIKIENVKQVRCGDDFIVTPANVEVA